MVSHASTTATTLTAATLPRVGVGIDTSRYGHYAAFLREDLQPAAAELSFAESAAGYKQLRERLEHVVRSQGSVHFVIRLDAAGQYADNLLHFVHGLADEARKANAMHITISCGDPERNKNYRVAHFGKKKSDPVEARACARFAAIERPAHVEPPAIELRVLRQVAGRLHAVVRQRTRLINQFHHLLALSFPELALLQKDIAVGWVLELVHRYPTADLLAKTSVADLESVPYLPHGQIDTLLEHARSSIASLTDDAMVELVREQVRQLRDTHARQKRLEKLLVSVYQRLPRPNHLNTIPGIGAVTAAVLTAFIGDIDRFATPDKLVAYFGTLPIEASSGVDRDGNPRGPKRYVMSRRGNDLVRRYLWMAGLSAVRHNPAVRALYARVVAKHPDARAIAIGHAMRKLLHLAYAVWKTDKPFDAEHFAWEGGGKGSGASGAGRASAASDNPMTPGAAAEATQPQQAKQAAGLKPAEPARKEVTAACAPSVAHAQAGLSPVAPPGRGAGVEGRSVRCDSTDAAACVDFAHVKRQLPMARVLDQLGLAARLKGPGAQKRCTCPIHRGDARGRTFSVNLDKNVFHCFDKTCGKNGDVIDLWSSVTGLSLRDAALDLVRTFHLEPAPGHGAAPHDELE